MSAENLSADSRLKVTTPLPGEGLGGGALKSQINMMKHKWIETLIRVVIAALSAALTAVTTTSCMGHGPLYF